MIMGENILEMTRRSRKLIKRFGVKVPPDLPITGFFEIVSLLEQ